MTHFEQSLGFDQLGTMIREALTAQGEASYQRGRFTAGAGGMVDSSGKMLEAVALADERVEQMWRAFYELAGDHGAALIKLDALTGVLSRITVAAAQVGIELEGAELIEAAQL